jgi:putative NADH-flavin reductase
MEYTREGAMKLVVFGATGGVGRQLVLQALEDGHSLTAVVRDPARFREEHPSLRVVTVPQLSDVDRVVEVVAGGDAVLSGVGPRSRKDVAAASGSTRGIIGGMGVAGVERVVVVSAAPVGPAALDDSWFDRLVVNPLVSRVFSGIYADLARMEAELAASGLKWTVVRPPRLTDKPLGQYRTAYGANVARGHFAARADVAHLMLASLTDDRAVNTAVGIAR